MAIIVSMAPEPKRCFWVSLDKSHYVEYHDTEWGVPVHNDQHHFEMLILEGAQAGLSRLLKSEPLISQSVFSKADEQSWREE